MKVNDQTSRRKKQIRGWNKEYHLEILRNETQLRIGFQLFWNYHLN